MAYLFSNLPANMARICANKPIHFIVFTVIAALFAYHALLENYIQYAFDNSNSVSLYHDATSGSSWTVTNGFETEIEHKYFLTPYKFKGYSDSEYPSLPEFIEGNDASEKFLLTDSEDAGLGALISNSQNVSFRYGSNKIGKYFEFFKFSLVRFKNLILGAEPFDIILMTFGYLAMLFSFLQLFLAMKSIGSKFWLFFGSLLSSGLAFLFSLTVATEILKLRIPLVLLSEGVPLLVATIGFKHKVAFTAPVVSALTVNTRRDISDVIYDVVKSRTAAPLIRDQLVISTAFLCTSLVTHHLPGLRNFCILSALTLSIDLFFTFTFFASILSLKAQITKVHQEVELKEVLEEDGIDSKIAMDVAGLSIDTSKGIFKQSRSIVLFKVLMMVGFIGLHLFALGTSWLYDDSTDYVPVDTSNSTKLMKALLSKVDANKKTLVTLLPTKVYREVNAVTEIEHYAYVFFSKIFSAIIDPLVSKFIIVLFGISIAINVYLLNVTRFHTFSNLKKEISEEPVTVEKKKSKKKSKSKKRVEMPIETVKPLNDSIDDVSDNVKVGEIVEDTQAEDSASDSAEASLSLHASTQVSTLRPLDDLVEIMKAGNVKECNNAEVTELVIKGRLPLYALEKQLNDKTRAVIVRRMAIAEIADAPVLLSEKLPYRDYDYDRVFGACCENVIGYLPLPVGIAGPIIIDGKPFHIPVATTEGCLVASAMRGCKAINAGGGVETVLTADGMTRGPCVEFPTLTRAGKAKVWLDSEEGQKKMKTAFNSTSRFARLQHIKTAIAGNSLYIRFKTTTGDAMGMNMISKGVEYSLKCMQEDFGFEDMDVVSVSGNYCIDKKAAAINWIEGRGKSIVASAIIPAEIVQKVLKSDVDALVELNISKNLVGSALAGAIGGFNAHAANLVTAVFLATGQDPAQNVESSNCLTLMKKTSNGDLNISVSMPSIEVGTIGGGTVLDPQGAMLELLGIRGPHPTEPGANARQLAKVVASAVLAAELSLCSALAAGHLVQSHMQHNRKAPASAPTSATNLTPTPALPSNSEGASNEDNVKRLTEGSKICIRS